MTLRRSLTPPRARGPSRRAGLSRPRFRSTGARCPRDTGVLEFLGRKLAVRGRSGMGRERSDIADVHEAREQLQRVEKARPALPPLSRRPESPKVKTPDAFPTDISSPVMIRVILEPAYVVQATLGASTDAGRSSARFRKCDPSATTGLDALQNQKRIEGGDRRARVAKRHHPRRPM